MILEKAKFKYFAAICKSVMAAQKRKKMHFSNANYSKIHLINALDSPYERHMEDY